MGTAVVFSRVYETLEKYRSCVVNSVDADTCLFTFARVCVRFSTRTKDGDDEDSDGEDEDGEDEDGDGEDEDDEDEDEDNKEDSIECKISFSKVR